MGADKDGYRVGVKEFERKKKQLGIVGIAAREGIAIYQAEEKERQNG